MQTRTRIALGLAAAAGLVLWLPGTVLVARQPPAPQSPVVAAPSPVPQPAIISPGAAPGLPADQESPQQRPNQLVTPAPVGMRPDAGQPVNVKVDVTITDQTGTAQPFKKTISVTVADRQSGMIRSSIQVPVPSTTFAQVAGGAVDKGAATSGPAPLTSYQYRSVNLNLDVREATIEGNFVRLRLGIEYSPVDEKTDAKAPAVPGMPLFANFQQTLSLVLENGKPLLVAESSDPVPGRDRRQSVEVRATVLR